MLDPIARPSHYLAGSPYETWKVLEQWIGRDGFLVYLQASAVKYLSRFGKKGSKLDAVNDLKKAAAFLHKAIELMEEDLAGDKQTKAATQTAVDDGGFLASSNDESPKLYSGGS